MLKKIIKSLSKRKEKNPKNDVYEEDNKTTSICNRANELLAVPNEITIPVELGVKKNTHSLFCSRVRV